MKKTALFAAVLAAMPVPAIANHVPSIAVETTDLDLASAKDQDRLESRVKRAIRKACHIGGKGFSVRQAEKECRSELEQLASAKVLLANAWARIRGKA